jgi:uncharacterized delta-60 repeat protein
LAGANGSRVGGLVRTTADGAVDEGFVVGAGIDRTIGVAVQADGMILAAGWLVGDVASNGAPNYRVLRFLTNGAMDPNYHSPVFGDTPRFLTIQPDGRVLAALTGLSGTTAPNGGIPDFARLNQDGSLDTTFQRPVLAGGLAGVYAPPVVDTNGAIYLAGGFKQVNGQNRNGVARLLSNGALDPTFLPSGFSFTLFNRATLV